MKYSTQELASMATQCLHALSGNDDRAHRVVAELNKRFPQMSTGAIVHRLQLLSMGIQMS